ncbi:MAG: helix-hairpin-helix domain-containing protein, partial [Bacteroidales bacterium]|nr:helix-hairpin-helix domain-containing protein [Bacteroidales bacterium]
AASEHRADAGISAETPLAKTAGRISEIARNAPVDINKADTSDLQTIRGIGPAFSRRIVGYRELLGGFLFKEQLKEVYGLDSLRYEEIKDFVVAGETEIRKININTADFSDLVRHPYIDRNIANAILNLRRQHGDFASANDLSMSYVINEEQLARMLPYICTGD